MSTVCGVGRRALERRRGDPFVRTKRNSVSASLYTRYSQRGSSGSRLGCMYVRSKSTPFRMGSIPPIAPLPYTTPGPHTTFALYRAPFYILNHAFVRTDRHIVISSVSFLQRAWHGLAGSASFVHFPPDDPEPILLTQVPCPSSLHPSSHTRPQSAAGSEAGRSGTPDPPSG